jgi:hypothetical protein
VFCNTLPLPSMNSTVTSIVRVEPLVKRHPTWSPPRDAGE